MLQRWVFYRELTERMSTRVLQIPGQAGAAGTSGTDRDD